MPFDLLCRPPVRSYHGHVCCHWQLDYIRHHRSNRNYVKLIRVASGHVYQIPLVRDSIIDSLLWVIREILHIKVRCE